MHATPAASARSRTISALSLIEGPTIATTPVPTSSSNFCSTDSAVPAGRPSATRAISSIGSPSRSAAFTSANPMRRPSSKY